MSSAIILPGPRYEALLQLLRTAETLWNSSRVFFARWNLSPSQFNILNLLHGLPTGRSQIDLSRDLIMHRSNITGLVDRLEARGLVKRRLVPEDRRAYCVVLTEKGAELVSEILPHYYTVAEQVWGDITAEKASELVSQLIQISTHSEKIAAQQSTNG